MTEFREEEINYKWGKPGIELDLEGKVDFH